MKQIPPSIQKADDGTWELVVYTDGKPKTVMTANEWHELLPNMVGVWFEAHPTQDYLSVFPDTTLYRDLGIPYGWEEV